MPLPDTGADRREWQERLLYAGATLLFNRRRRVHALWRLILFAVFYTVALILLFNLTYAGLEIILGRRVGDWLGEEAARGFVLQSVVFFVAAAAVGWACARALEDLPWRSLGWALHRGWARDLLLGLGLSALSIGLLAAVGLLFGGYRFAAMDAPSWSPVVRTLAVSGFVFLLGAAMEEMLFRGYPLQTTLRSWPAPVALVLPSVAFAAVHLDNPNVAPFFTFTNTALAGVWLGVAYWRTRSLWFATGLHWGWNWVQGAVLGSPVSGITELTPAPLLRFEDSGPAWLGGGAYGFEGGAACTLALVASTLFVWRTRLLAATPELRAYTDGENPNPRPPSVFAREAAPATRGNTDRTDRDGRTRVSENP
jgi:uncharacterized protein